MTAPRPATDLFTAKTMLFGLRLMQDFELTDFQAAGVFGNLGHESGGFRLLQEIKPVVKGSRGGYGWAQWTGPRRTQFETWCAQRKLIPSTDEASYGYLCQELRGPEAGAITALRKAHDLSSATDAFCRTFERPGIVNLPSRMIWAKRALAAIGKGLAAHEAEKVVAAKAAEASTPKTVPSKKTAHPSTGKAEATTRSASKPRPRQAVRRKA